MADEPTRNIEVTSTRMRGLGLGEKIKNFEPAMLGEWLLGRIQRQKNTAFYGKILTILLCTYFLGDLSAIFVSKYLPEAPVVRARAGSGFRKIHSIDEYGVIFARNLFNSNGIIPGEENGGSPTDQGGVPVRTTLPFNLVGTMILADDADSIATIEDKTAQVVYPVRVDDEIPGKAKILKIELRKVTFVNISTGRREFIDLPVTEEVAPTQVAVGSPSGGIEQVAATQFSVNRSEIDKALSNINNILTQARAVPHFENGAPAGYKLFQIVPGSIYSQLGLKDGDVICGFNGQPANDPAVAFQQLSDLKNQSHLDLCVKRDGRQSTYGYDFR